MKMDTIAWLHLLQRRRDTIGCILIKGRDAIGCIGFKGEEVLLVASS
jgi:hypothetical protein